MTGIIAPYRRERWQHRAVQETGGNTTLMGCFVLAILGWQHGRHPPRFGSKAVIDAEGIVITHMQDKNGVKHHNHRLGHVKDIVDSFRGLADHLKLDDWEREEMFAELRKWFYHDARANAINNKERGLQ